MVRYSRRRKGKRVRPYRIGDIFDVSDRESVLNVAPSKPRGGHTISKHFGRKRIEEDPHSFGNLLVSEKRRNADRRNVEVHKRRHARQLQAEQRAKKKPHLDYKPITSQLEDDELQSFF